MKYNLIETEAKAPDYRYVRRFNTLKEAYEAMAKEFRDLVYDWEDGTVNQYVETAMLAHRDSYVRTLDENEISWSIEEEDDTPVEKGRHHPLRVGEVVFDADKKYFGVIVELSENHAKLDMNGRTDESIIVPDCWCEYENKLMMDMEVSEDDLVWETDNLRALYQVAWGIRDSRTGNIVCYEHVPMDDEYPYYSPYLEENLFEFETEEV